MALVTYVSMIGFLGDSFSQDLKRLDCLKTLEELKKPLVRDDDILDNFVYRRMAGAVDVNSKLVWTIVVIFWGL